MFDPHNQMGKYIHLPIITHLIQKIIIGSHRMYVLLVRTKGRLNPLRIVFEKHVKRSCLYAAKRIS